MNIRCNITVTGVVQAVGYREEVRKAAVIEGLKGYVQNRADRSVMIVCEGPKKAIGRFLRAIDIQNGRIEVSCIRPKYSRATGQFRIFEIRLGKGISPDTLEIIERLNNGLVVMDRLAGRMQGMDSHIQAMDSNIGGHFEKLDQKYDRFGSSLAQVADDIHEMKGDLRKAVAGREPPNPA